MRQNKDPNQQKSLERPHYFTGQMLTASDFQAEQDYYRAKMRRHNRFMHGWGIVCGLQVTARPTRRHPWRVRVEPGYALAQTGDSIWLPGPAYLTLADPWRSRRRARRPNGDEAPVVYVAIQYAEELANPVPVMGDGEESQFSRIRDSYQLACLTELAPAMVDEALPCPPPLAQSSPWVILARVMLPLGWKIALPAGAVDETVRRELSRQGIPNLPDIS